MIEEARLEPVESGLTPVTRGWFAVNAGEAAWMNNDQTESCCIFESDDFVLRGRPDLTEYEKPGAGFVLRVLRPGRPTSMYHAESVQEDFLVLRGEARGLAPMDAGRHTDQLGEPIAEGARRRAADLETDLDDAEIATTQQRHPALDAPRQIGVRRLAVRESR